MEIQSKSYQFLSKLKLLPFALLVFFCLLCVFYWLYITFCVLTPYLNGYLIHEIGPDQASKVMRLINKYLVGIVAIAILLTGAFSFLLLIVSHVVKLMKPDQSSN